MSASKLHNKYEECRRFPRIPVSVPIKIINGPSQILEAMVYDISPDGIQIRCNQETAHLLHPVSELISKNRRPFVEILFTLTIKNKERKVTAKCQIVYRIDLQDPESEAENTALGLNFTTLKGRSSKFVNQFLFKK